MSHTSALFQLQQVDSVGDRLRKRLSEVEALLNENEAIRAAQAALKGAEETHLKWKTRQTDLELERAQMRQEQEAAHHRLYSGQIHNPRELTDLQDKVAELDHRLEALEEPLLEAMVGVDEGQQAAASARQQLERVTHEQSQLLGELTTERGQLLADLKAHESRASQLRNAIEAAALAVYDRLRQRSPIAVAELRAEQCGVCRSEIMSTVAQQARHGQVVTCPTCGRILHHV